jgi:hypothetical protein
MCHLLLAGYEDAPSFLNQWKLNRSLCYCLYTVHIIYYQTWCDAKYIAFGFASARIIKSPFSGNSCARKMCHLFLAGYEDAPSFLNQWKLNRSLCYSLYTLNISMLHYKSRCARHKIQPLLLLRILLVWRCFIFLNQWKLLRVCITIIPWKLWSKIRNANI